MDASADIGTLVQTAKQLALLAETLERRSAAAATQHEHAAQALSRAVTQVRGDVDRVVQAAANQVTHGARSAVEGSLHEAAARFDQAAANASAKVQTAATALEVNVQRTQARFSRQLLWGYAAIVGAIVLIVVGGGVLLRMEQQAYADARARTAEANVSADTAAAFAQVNMTSCGGRPCVRLDAKSPRWGDKGQYVLIETKANAR